MVSAPLLAKSPPTRRPRSVEHPESRCLLTVAGQSGRCARAGEVVHAPGLVIVTDPIVMVVVSVGLPCAMVASKVLPPPLLGKVPLQFDQSATVVQLAVASFHEQVKLAA